MKKLLFFMAWMLSVTAVSAQTQQPAAAGTQPRSPAEACPYHLPHTPIEKYREEVKMEREWLKTRQMADVYNVPVAFHVIRTSSGTGGPTEAEVIAELNACNVQLGEANIELFMCRPVHFVNSNYYWNHQFTIDEDEFCGSTGYQYQLNDAHGMSNVLNIYIVNTEGWNWATFPSSADEKCADWIFLNNDAMGTSWLLAHEAGHWFNLYHTHQGDENITRNSGSGCYNCDDSGDLLCDTQADPNDWDEAGCPYDGFNTDNCGSSAYVPDETNLMSYANGCQTHFTSGQEGRMQYATTFLRSYIDCPYLSNCTDTWSLSANQSTIYSYQANNWITSTADILGSAESVYDAGSYVNLTPGFVATSGTTFTARIEGCWGPGIYLQQPADDNDAEAAAFLDEPRAKKPTLLGSFEAMVVPNPAYDVAVVHFSLPADEPLFADLADATGRTVQRLAAGERWQKGTARLDLNLEGLPAGTYFVNLRAGENHQVLPVVVLSR